jgi:serine/threonine protein kinase
MEKFDGNLKDFIFIFKNNKLLKTVLSSNLQLLETSLLHINKTCNICIDDIKLENILYKINSKGIYEFVFSDFGTSVLYQNVDNKTFEDCLKKDERRFNNTVEEFLSNF